MCSKLIVLCSRCGLKGWTLIVKRVGKRAVHHYEYTVHNVQVNIGKWKTRKCYIQVLPHPQVCACTRCRPVKDGTFGARTVKKRGTMREQRLAWIKRLQES